MINYTRISESAKLFQLANKLCAWQFEASFYKRNEDNRVLKLSLAKSLLGDDKSQMKNNLLQLNKIKYTTKQNRNI